jgi:hypothetical protein
VCETGIAKLELPAARTSGHKRKEKRSKIAFPQILHYRVQICGTHFLRCQPEKQGFLKHEHHRFAHFSGFNGFDSL